MFILSTIDNIINDYIRRTGKSTKGKACRETIRGTRDSVRDSKERSSGSRELYRLGKDNVSICCQSRERTFSNKQESRIRVYLSLIPLYIFYNPYILIAIIYIDMLFADELIYINAMQLNVIIESLQRFNNIGVV